ncbi:MAG: DinB superfamily protein [Ignavibacteriae bacterium]|nr:MAG: DinB superfamily protein [Ignavibacteriota bacterium]
MIETLIQLFQRDLEKLKTEITSYKDKNKIWDVSGELKNSAGNLCLHICGNLQHFVGAVLGNSGYERKRDLEFSQKDVSVEEMEKEIDKTLQVVTKTLNELKEEKLDETFPINVFGYEMTTGFFLTHLATHLSYHLGQINYQRRLLDTE